MNGISGILLLGQGRLDDLANAMAEGFRGESVHFRPESLAIGCLAVAAVLLLWWFLARRLSEDRAAGGGPWPLFFRLCRAHRLTWSDWWLLRRLAQFHRLDEPARLFLEPERFDAHRLPEKSAARLAVLKRQLFAGLEG